MGSGFAKMKKQARMMQEQFGQMRDQLKNKQVIGTAGNGLVSVTLNGEKSIQSISIKPDCVNKDDIDGLQDLIIAAFQDAEKKIDAEQPSPKMMF